MEILRRDEAEERFDAWWQNMHHEWFKLEVLQDYGGQDDNPSLRSWLAGDHRTSLELLAQMDTGWRARCQEKVSRGVLLRRVRIVERPFTPYTAWEMGYYRHTNIPGGEQVLLVDREDVGDLELQAAT